MILTLFSIKFFITTSILINFFIFYFIFSIRFIFKIILFDVFSAIFMVLNQSFKNNTFIFIISKDDFFLLTIIPNFVYFIITMYIHVY